MITALRKVEGRGAHEIAHRIKATCARVFTYASQQGIENRNPAADMKDVLKPVKAGHFAAITADELPAFLAAMDKNDARLFRPTRIALRLMMLVFVRTSEHIETPWSEINLDAGEWVIPWHRMKRGKLTVNPDTTDHHVCLSRQAVELLRELHTLTGVCESSMASSRSRGCKCRSCAARLSAERAEDRERLRLECSATGVVARSIASISTWVGAGLAD